MQQYWLTYNVKLHIYYVAFVYFQSVIITLFTTSFHRGKYRAARNVVKG